MLYNDVVIILNYKIKAADGSFPLRQVCQNLSLACNSLYRY